jgi:hypothetical protein
VKVIGHVGAFVCLSKVAGMAFKSYKRGQAVGIKTDDPDTPQLARVIHDSDENTDAISLRTYVANNLGTVTGVNIQCGKAGLVDIPQEVIDKMEAEPL